MPPQQALEALQAGNERFASGQSNRPRLDMDRIRETFREGQRPFATILGCSDSRVPLETIFDQGIGDLFIIRVAGNVMGVNEMGSIEYGVDHLYSPLMVVMGHTHCGACQAVANNIPVQGHIPALVAPICRAVDKVRKLPGEFVGDAFVNAVVEENVWTSISDLLSCSADTVKHVRHGLLQVVGAIYDIESGRVRWLGEHPRQQDILSGKYASTCLDGAVQEPCDPCAPDND